MKELLEGAAARLLAQRGRVPEIDLLRDNLEQADAAVARDDRDRYAELVEEFHDLLIRGADNTKLEAHYRMLMNQLAYSAAGQHLARSPAGHCSPTANTTTCWT